MGGISPTVYSILYFINVKVKGSDCPARHTHAQRFLQLVVLRSGAGAVRMRIGIFSGGYSPQRDFHGNGWLMLPGVHMLILVEDVCLLIYEEEEEETGMEI